MTKKLLCESLDEFRQLNEEGEPLALAVLGAPAGGKSFTTDNIKKFVKDQRISDALDKGVALTVDKLRNEFQSKNPLQQLVGFVRAFYYLRKRSLEDASEYGQWFEEISALWRDKIAKLAPALKITVDKQHIYFNGAPAWKSLKALRNTEYSPETLIKELDRYKDYKKVVRYFQNIQQSKAIKKTLNVSYDESGDEPKKIINTMKQLHKKGYVTDVFLIHPENVATNLIQNYYRVLTGGDGGRDSSEAIMDAYIQIEKNKGLYNANSEDNLKTTTQALQKENPKVGDTIEKANVEDDPRRGDKPIDVFTEVETMKPIEAYNFFNKKLNQEQQIIYRALLKYCTVGIPKLPDNAKSVLAQISKSINNKQALDILRKAADSGKYIYQWHGVTPALVKKAETVLK
jgi:hypothetical protein